MKKCSKCDKEQPLKEFYSHKETKDRKQPHCKTCHSKMNARWYRENTAQHQENTRRWTQKNKQRRRDHSLKARYGLDLGEYNRMFEAQGGKCAICDRTSKKPLRVDHCHRTGAVRGLLCHRCNIMLGFIEDQEMYQNAIKYLMQAQLDALREQR